MQQIVIPNVVVAPVYEQRFRPGRLCILAARLTMRAQRGTAPPLEMNFALYGAYEPFVPGTLPGLRVNTGRMHVFEVPGRLTTGSDLCPAWLPPEGAVISVMYATVAVAPQGQAILFQFLLDGADWTAYRISFNPLGAAQEIVWGRINIGDTKSEGYVSPETYANLAGVQAGVFVSGIQEGNLGGKELKLNITQVGSGSTPGEGLRVYAPY